MVKLALERLQEEGVVELDEETKAAMVSNLLAVRAVSRRPRAGREHRFPVPVTAAAPVTAGRVSR